MAAGFEVGLTRDFLTPDGKMVYRDIGLSILDEVAGIRHRFLEAQDAEMKPEQLEGLDAIISLTPRYTASSLVNGERLLAIVRFGVGYEMVDLSACTEAGVLVCITAGAVNYSVAEAIITWMLALSHRVLAKDRLVRAGRWAERGSFMGSELRDRTLGVIGLGGIGSQLVRMLASFQMQQPMAFDPMVSGERAREVGAQLVKLEVLLAQSDFVAVCCPLTDQTRGLIGMQQLSKMKPSAYLINAARGGIVDEMALVKVLQEEKIAGAAIDVYAHEPVARNHPLCELDNVILAPHAIAWTDELFRDIGRSAARAVAALSKADIPLGVVNPEVLQRVPFKQKLERLRQRRT